MTKTITGAVLLSLSLLGCGGGSSSSTPDLGDNSEQQTTEVKLAVLEEEANSQSSRGEIPVRTVSNTTPKSLDESSDSEDSAVEVPHKNTPEWSIYQITQLKLRPLTESDTPIKPEKQAQLRQERNQQIIDLATEAIARTHKDKSKERVFDLAVHHLLEAELQLALAGQRDHIDAIYEHASSLYKRSPKSKSAIEAGTTLISLARVNAQRFGATDPKSVEEFARLARQFAQNFPHDERQAGAILLAAGQTCEFHGLSSEALQCYSVIREQFPESQMAEQIKPILRRLNLKGQPIQVAGPTIGGGFVSAEELVGKPLLVVFWNTQAQPFVRQLPTILNLLGKIEPGRLNVISVNLDNDDNEAAVQTFLESNDLPWPTIFHTQEDKRGWNNPVAIHYGIQFVPQYWLVSSKGNVVEMANDIRQLESWLQKLMVPRTATKP